MEDKFPETIFVSECGSGEDAYLAANRTEHTAIAGTDDGTEAEVAEYRLVKVTRLKIVTTVTTVDA